MAVYEFSNLGFVLNYVAYPVRFFRLSASESDINSNVISKPSTSAGVSNTATVTPLSNKVSLPS